MKILDKYVVKNFLTGYAIAFAVLIGLRIIIDLFVNVDEFTERADLGTAAVVRNMLIYYGLNSTLYFRDFAGMITVVAAAFSFGRMVHSNELVAVMSSGVSLKRLIGPVVLFALVFTALLVVDQELIIPKLASKLVRDRDEISGQESFDVWFLNDGNNSLISSRMFAVQTSTLYWPTIILRRIKPGTNRQLEVAGLIWAERAVYNYKTHKWDLVNGRLIERGSTRGVQPIQAYDSGDLTAQDVPIMRSSQYKTLLSWSQLDRLARQKMKVKDAAQLWSQKHFRVTDPIINLIMLMVSLPGACFITTFVCKILATEVVFDMVMPELWAWLPVLIFLPVAFVEFDSMKT